MTCLFDIFTGQTLHSLERARDLTGSWTDLCLDFGKSQLVFFEPCTIPFTKTDGKLRRFKNWLKPPEEWGNHFVGKQLVSLHQEKNIHLEFSDGSVLLSGNKVVGLYHQKQRIWSTWETTTYDAQK